MYRRLSALWTPALAVLLAGLLFQPAAGWSGRELAVGSARVSASPFKAVLPSARLQPALHFRSSPLERQGTPLGAFIPSRNQAGAALAGVIASSAIRVRPLPAESARHFPLFPTGPPSHG